MSALIITTNYGVEQDELVRPLDALKGAGVPVTLAAVSMDPIRTLVSDKDPGAKVEPDSTLTEVDPKDYDVLVIPGGTINADTLRTHPEAVALVREFADAGKTIAAICHGPWLLVESGVADGRTVTSYPSLQTDLRNAGATWVDEELKRCEAEPSTLLTSRNPRDLDAFVPAVVEAAR